MHATKLFWLPLLLALFVPSLLIGQEPADDAPASQPPLSAEQQAAKNRFDQFEKSLYQLYDYMRRTDPDRADLLERAFKKSREDQISIQMQQLVELLEEQEYGDAVSRQEDLLVHLNSLLDLLQSEDRMSELEKEQKRIEALLKDVNRVIGKEKAVQAETQKGGDADRLAGKQKGVAEDTEKIVDDIDRHDDKQSGDKQSGDKQAGDKQSGDKQSGDKQSGDKQSGDKQSGDKQSGDKQSGDKQSGDKQSGDKQSGDKQSQTPGREELEQAKREMERAIEELKKKNREDASDAQDEALQKLIAAKEKLEEILRQLREEERELVLAALEARFQKMLNMQVIVLDGTIRLSKSDDSERESSRFTGRALELARLEGDIALEADKALTVLKAEGSSVAFPIAVEDLRTDILTIVQRLEERKVDDLTQAIERDIVEALQEMIEALQREMEKDSKEGQPCDCNGSPVLVDKLAELKMLRTLQKRVNRRTRTLGRLIEGEQTDDPDVLEQLRELSRRQARIVQTAYDITTTREQ